MPPGRSSSNPHEDRHSGACAPLERCCLLAAGRGRRAGGPKAWLASDGVPLIKRQLSFLTSLVSPEAVSVAVQESWLERCRSLSPGTRFVAVDPEAPPLASLLALLSDRPLEGWTSLHHVDMPVWEPALFEPPPEGDWEAAVWTRGGRGGHPVLLSESLRAEIDRLDPSKDRLDRFLRGRRVLRRETALSCAFENWNVGPTS
ncbi:MAG: hypothetical protein CO113_01955 [Elusimicrobia bacterium CG_4_9_14_3_um_filter_62_55]|nr:MAG: hypothetical protein CO113_01955 [Elusimicrobia bacterium CG_4_9_14_3_um_filter_62_55]